MMKDQKKSKAQLITELSWLRRRIAELESMDNGHPLRVAVLSESEQKYKWIFDDIPLGYQLLDEKGNVVGVNRAWLNLFGFSREEVIGRWFGDLLAPESVDRFRESFHRFKATGEIRGIEFEMVRKDGTHMRVSLNGKIGCDETGSFRQTHCILQDITEQKRMEGALRESEERFRNILENSPIGIYRTTPDGQIIMANQVLLEMLGYTSFEDIAERHLEKEGYHPAYPRSSFKREMENQGIVKGFEAAWIRKNGSTMFLRENARAVHDGDGNIVYYDGTVEDITERREAEEALRESEEKFRNLVENTIDWVWQVDRDGAYTYVSPNVLQIMGYCEEEIIGKTPFDFMPPGEAQSIAGMFQEIARRKERIVALESTLLNKNGQPVIFETNATPLLNEDGVLNGYFGTCRDITGRKLAEKEMQVSEQRYRLLFEQNLAAVYRTTVDGQIIDCNHSFAKLLGYDSPDEMKHFRVTEFYFEPSDREVFLHHLRERGALKSYDSCLRRRDGTPVWILKNASLIMEVDGEVVIQGTAIDITERKQTERFLRESEEKYRLLVENANECIIVAQDGMIRLANPKMSAVSGYTQEELTSKSFVEFIHPEDREMVMQHHALRLKGEENPMSYILRAVAKNGEVKWLENNGVIIDWEGRPATLNFLTDITDRKEAEDQLQFLSSISEQVSDSIITTDLNYRITYINKAAENLFGYGREELIGQLPVILNAEPMAETLQNEIYRTVSSGESYSGMWRNRRKNGTTFFCEMKVAPMRDEKGQPYGYISVQRDITDQKEAEEQLRIYQNQLRSVASKLALAEEQERRFLATQLHDGIGQSLAITKVKLGALKKEMGPSELAGYVDEIQSIVEQTIQDARTLTFDLSPPILYELGFEPAVEWLTDQIQERHGIHTNCDDDLQPKPLDDDIRVVLFQAVRELLFNIVKHARAQHIEVSLQRTGNRIRVCVSDDGTGFDPSFLREPGKKEIGFGLFNIRERLDHLGGHMELSSKPKKGTNIILVAPLKK